MFGVICVMCVPAYVYFHVKEQSSSQSDQYETLNATQDNPESQKRRKKDYLFIVFMFLVLLSGQGFPSGYSGLLATFGIESRLQISLSTMTLMTSHLCTHFQLKPRRGFLLNIHVTSSFQGVIIGIIGPILPDLRCLFNAGLDELSLLLLVFGVGGIFSQLIISFVMENVPIYIVLGVLIVLKAIYFFSFPYAGNIIMGTILQTLAGVLSGACFNPILYKCGLLWPGNPRLVHLHFGVSSFGSVLAPLVIGPFLSDGAVTEMYKTRYNITTDRGPFQHNNTPVFNAEHIQNRRNLTSVMNVSSLQIDSIDCSGPDGITLLQYPFIMFGVICVMCVPAYVYFHVKEQSSSQSDQYETLNATQDNPESQKRRKKDYLFIVFMFLVLLSGQGFPSGYSGLLATFGIESRLQISLSTMTLMTSVFWFSFLIGRLVPCILPASVKQIYILSASFTGLLIGIIVFCFSFDNTAALWVASVILGLFSAPVLPAGLACSKQILNVSPRIGKLKSFLLSYSLLPL
ncbi:uncharacterized protein LOC124274201 [Haliotis rubra]|uniref:uncharacterized protein LOC124274201 n=1 Tax=Haliotis rubra TaxID=36100 RepID=UPI001EE5CF38|nr:uncharacterized protein LOC124274201 [Haliotis rubra]